MKKILLLTVFMFMAISLNSQNEKNININYPDNVYEVLTEKEKTMIEEVYHLKTNEIVYKDESFLKDLKHLLRNRITIYKDDNPKTQKNGKNLSEVPLFDTYNKDLKRDTNFDINSFNPLKYKLDFFANGTYVYRIDNTNYFIQITSQYRNFKR